ncbi:MAG: outer membrane beta-barrel protein [Pseudomonadota bacterium]
MKVLKTGLVSVALLATTMAAPAFAADLYGGSLKDEPIHAAPAAVGGCYLRGDIGYGWNDADASEIAAGATPYQTSDLDDGMTWGLGGGCARSNGLRWDILYTFHGDNLWDGIPAPPDPIFADIETHSLMANLYYDFDMGRRFKPYVGAGIGVAYHDMGALDCTPAIPGVCTPGNFQRGGENVTFAWSLMAGTAFEVSDRVTLDAGYRYLDMGGVESGRVDITGFVNPGHRVEDITSHEIKFGLRFAIH